MSRTHTIAGPPLKDRLAFPLDVSSWAEAHTLVEALHESVGVFKVGLELFTAEGPSVVTWLIDRGHKVFLDLKLHDIPETMARAVDAALRLRVNYLTVHASAGREALAKAAEVVRGTPLTLLGVTVLTSSDDQTLQQIGMQGPPPEAVLRLAKLATDAGIAGLVCSPAECELLRVRLGGSVFLVTPGVRPSGSAFGDQRRVATPGEAIAAGADMLVVGRPIRDAKEPKAMAASILQEIARAIQ
jgi:orotidine-5'-phosphate decarboxylase